MKILKTLVNIALYDRGPVQGWAHLLIEKCAKNVL